MDNKVLICICIVVIVVIIICCLIFLRKDDIHGNNISNETASQIEEISNYTFTAIVTKVDEKRLTVDALEGDDVVVSTGTIAVLLGDDNQQVFKVGDKVEVTFNGQVMRSYPAQVYAIKIELLSSDNAIKEETFTATITEVDVKRLTVDVKDENTLGLLGTVVVLLGNDNTQEFKVGDKIEITFNGQVMLSEPPQVFAIEIKRVV